MKMQMKSKMLTREFAKRYIECEPLDKEKVLVKVTRGTKELVFTFKSFPDFLIYNGISNNQSTVVNIVEDVILFDPKFMDQKTTVRYDRKILRTFFYKEFDLDVEIESIRIFDYKECPKAIKFSDTFKKIKALLKEEKSQ